MKKIYYIKCLLLIALTGMVSCGPSPKKVVAQTWLNTNNVTTYYSPKFFNELMEKKAKNNITVYQDGAVIKGTAVAYVQQYVIATIDENLKKVEDLSAKGDNKELIDASLEVFRYSSDVFENEYLDIAEMIDEEKPSEEIMSAIDDLFAKHDGEMQIRFDRLDSCAIPYAEKNNIAIIK
ncbi:hypothetical protein [Sphingobacterium chuzhouense]|uniref:DUF4142 domain-containing protein n=1 Tax=Sphingobacterium chuzhouense TaxID=1742264 RepID=A0ABR7XVY4_9SPHI|nr:hypothetical protein [Sphingobacterium chuzhouense]MBD1423213.1 hypothetical protein [Sphingobacterium chuzhouense]